MNDPNGLIQWNGLHHLFFQHDPDHLEPRLMRWGHATSADLLTWQIQPDALLPGLGGTDYDRDGCFSGCAVTDGDGVALLYTGVRGHTQLPCLARSVDSELRTFAKYGPNPVIAEPPVNDAIAFRDHSLLRRDGQWRHVVGGGTDSLGGAVFGYVGDSLEDWKFDQIVLDSSRAGIPGAIWECPDLFAGDGADALIVSVVEDLTVAWAHATPNVWYAVGDFVDGKFDPRHVAVLDHGDRFYAPQSYWTADGRRLMFGWIRTDLDPMVRTRPTLGAMTLPRELTVRDNRLVQIPAREVAALRRQSIAVPLDDVQGTTSIALRRPASGVEILVADHHVPIEAIDLFDETAAASYTVRLQSQPAAEGLPNRDGVRLFFDDGIIEVFTDGDAATWTALALRALTSVTIRWAEPPTSGAVTVWELALP